LRGPESNWRMTDYVSSRFPVGPRARSLAALQAEAEISVSPDLMVRRVSHCATPQLVEVRGSEPRSCVGDPRFMLQAYPSVFGGRPLSALWTPSRQPAPQRASAAHPCAPSPGGDPSSGYEGYLAGSGGVVVTPRPWRGPRHSGKHSCWQLNFLAGF